MKKLIGRLTAIIEKMPVRCACALAFFAYVLVETLSRRSFLGVFVFLWKNPLMFAMNLCIVLCTFIPAVLTRRRFFFFMLPFAAWTAFGLVNFILLSYRTTPFTAVDILMLDQAFALIKIYMTVPQIVLLCAGIAAGIAMLVLLWIKMPKISGKINYKRLVWPVAAAAVTLALMTGISNAAGVSADAENVAASYDSLGFAYCLSSSFIDVGIGRPDDYSREKIEQLVEGANAAAREGDERTPDIIFVQLESFIDVNLLKNAELSENPIPYFTYLKSAFPHGFLSVPTVGAGTAQTEFEVLSGMNLEYFGFCEYPYKTILKKTACPSLPFDLAGYGYTSHALHNNNATFYGRNTVFSSLGFDTFTASEYMPGIEFNAMGWAKDDVLTGEIIKALDSTKGQDFVFAISVQSHGKYYEIPAAEGEKVITASGLWDESDRLSFEYYLRQLCEVDRFISDLVSALEKRGQPVLLVLYGDHHPTFGYTEDDLKEGTMFQTEYVIWSNIKLSADGRDLSTYQLPAYITGLLGLDGGVINRYHHAYMESDDREAYEDGLWALQYDLLYGDRYACGGEYPYDFSDIRLGVAPVSIAGFKTEGGKLYVYGENFTPYSRVRINGSSSGIDTEFVDENMLVCTGRLPAAGDKIAVVQVSALTESVSHPLSSSDEVEFR